MRFSSHILLVFRSTVALLGLQVINQAFTTIVNYTNRSITTNELDESKNTIVAGEAFLCGAAASSMVVYGLKKIFYCRGPLFAVSSWTIFCIFLLHKCQFYNYLNIATNSTGRTDDWKYVQFCCHTTKRDYKRDSCMDYS